MAEKYCKYGDRCHRKDCKYAHLSSNTPDLRKMVEAAVQKDLHATILAGKADVEKKKTKGSSHSVNAGEVSIKKKEKSKDCVETTFPTTYNAPVLLLARAHQKCLDQKVATLREKAVYDAKYDRVDSKGVVLAVTPDPFADKLNLLEVQLRNYRGMVKTAVGPRNNYRVTLSGLYNFTATITTGIVNTVNAITPASYSDFTALQGLFEEYKITECDYSFWIGKCGASNNTTVVNNSNTQGVLSFSLNSTPLVSVGAAADDTYAKKFNFPIAILAVAGGLVIQPGSTTGYRFKFKLPSGVNDASLVLGPGEWVSTASSAGIWGYMKSYWVVCEAAASTPNALNGTILTQFHFRNRV